MWAKGTNILKPACDRKSQSSRDMAAPWWHGQNTSEEKQAVAVLQVADLEQWQKKNSHLQLIVERILRNLICFHLAYLSFGIPSV